jgi:hypothetical protein
MSNELFTAICRAIVAGVLVIALFHGWGGF